MSVIKWGPFFEPFEEMEKMFAERMPTLRKGFTPAVDVYEDKDNIVVETPLPGIDPAKVDILIQDDVLTIKGESEKKSELEEKDYYRKEVRLGSFYRSVSLPAKVVGEKAKATSVDGLLKITVPKAPQTQAKTIKIQTVKSEKTKKN